MGAGISLFWGWENGILQPGLGFTNEKTIEKWEWDLDLNKTMGMGFAQNPDCEMDEDPPPFRTLLIRYKQKFVEVFRVLAVLYFEHTVFQVLGPQGCRISLGLLIYFIKKH